MGDPSTVVGGMQAIGSLVGGGAQIAGATKPGSPIMGGQSFQGLPQAQPSRSLAGLGVAPSSPQAQLSVPQTKVDDQTLAALLQSFGKK